MRDYNKEYARDCERDTIIKLRVHKEEAEKFKAKAQKEGKTYSEILREQIEKYVNE